MINKTIHIASASMTTTATGKLLTKIKDGENKSYQLWHNKQDGSETVAYQAYKILPNMGIGCDVEVAINEEQGNYQGKPVIYRSIVGLQPRTYNQQPAQPNPQTAKLTARAEDKKWEDISRGKVRHGVACEFIRLGKSLTEETAQTINEWVNYIMTGNINREQHYNEPTKEDYQDVEGGGMDINVENIPFN